MKLKIYEPHYTAEGIPVEELAASDYELVYDGEVRCLDLDNLFYSFSGRDAPYGYFGRSIGRGHVVCVYGGVYHGRYLCEDDGIPRFSRIDFDERLAYDSREQG